LVDLHTHTTASDGTDSPAELVARARQAGIQALAITDHDTFLGYDQARDAAADSGIRLICALELSTRLLNETDPRSRSAHILGYFPCGASEEFRSWLETLRERRRSRNALIAEKLRERGMDVTLEEAESIGRNITGRPHFARILLDKGYVSTLPEAFRLYLGDGRACYVEREDPSAEEGISRIRSAGGIPSLAHAVRLSKKDPAAEEAVIGGLACAGLTAIEVYHSDHDENSRMRYLGMAAKFGLRVTGGSDYHGDNKPEIALGRGKDGNLNLPLSLLQNLENGAPGG